MVVEGKGSSVGLYLTDRQAQTTTVLALVSIADSLVRLVDDYDAEEEEK